jgi:hypothetical protein
MRSRVPPRANSYAPRGFVIDETVLSEDLRAKVRFHFLEKTGRVARGVGL